MRDLLEGETDPNVRARLESVARPQIEAEVVAGVTNRGVFRSALARAKADGHPDPVLVAVNESRWEAMKRAHERRVAQIFGRVKARSIARDNRVAIRQERLAKCARPDIRRRPHQDRAYVDLLGKAEKAGWLGDTTSVALELTSKLKAYKPPPWDKTTTALKVLAYSLESHTLGAMTFNLRLGREVGERALESDRGPAAYLQDNIRKALKTVLADDAPDFWFTIEGGARPGTLHVHGAIVIPPDPDVEERVASALRKAGGKWASPQGQHHQLLMKVMDRPFGWASYTCKELNITGRDIDRRLVGVTAGLARAARERWPDTRERLPRV